MVLARGVPARIWRERFLSRVMHAHARALVRHVAGGVVTHAASTRGGHVAGVAAGAGGVLNGLQRVSQCVCVCV